MIFTLGACLREQKKTDLPELGEDVPSRVFVTTVAGAKAALEQAQMRYEGEVQLSEIGFCKVENQQECMIGSFYIPKLLETLRSYYDELMDLGRELETNENGFFAKKQTKYFGTVTDRADRLMSKAVHLLEYAGQVRDAYQGYVDARQNANMQFLTVISTIFFPLTLITGWYGMNFQNMPELRSGYPGVIFAGVLVVLLLILYFKRKKML